MTAKSLAVDIGIHTAKTIITAVLLTTAIEGAVAFGCWKQEREDARRKVKAMMGEK